MERSPASIRCKKCNFFIADYEDDDLIQHWNNRPIEDALCAENERLRETLREIANSAGIDGCGYTTGEGHADCVWKARKALNNEVTK